MDIVLLTKVEYQNGKTIIYEGLPPHTNAENIFHDQLIASHQNIDKTNKKQVLDVLTKSIYRIFAFTNSIDWNKEANKNMWELENPDHVDLDLVDWHRLASFTKNFFEKLTIDENLIDRSIINQVLVDILDPSQKPIRPRLLYSKAVYMIINNLIQYGMKRDATFTWLIDNTVSPTGQKYTKDIIEIQLNDLGFDSLDIQFINEHVDRVMRIIKCAIEGKEFNTFYGATPNNYNIYKLNDIVNKFVEKFLFQGNSQLIYLTPRQLFKRLPSKTIHSIITNLMYNREDAYDWLISNTVNRNGKSYTREVIDTVLIQYGFNNIVVRQKPIFQCLDEIIITTAINDAESTFSMSKVQSLQLDFSYDGSLTYFTTMCILNFLDPSALL